MDWLAAFPIDEMIAYGWIERRKDKDSQLIELLNFFGIVSPMQWETYYQAHAVCFRQSQSEQINQNAVLVWLRQGELEAQKIRCAPFDRSRFLEVIKAARGMTTFKDQMEAIREVIRRSALAGVAIVLVRELSNTRVLGNPLAFAVQGPDPAQFAL